MTWKEKANLFNSLHMQTKFKDGITNLTFSRSTFSDVTLKRPFCWTTGAFALSSSSSLLAASTIPSLFKKADKGF